MKYLEILKENKVLESSFAELSYDVNILSNVTVFKLKEVLEYYLRESSIPAKVNIGDYDTIVQDSFKIKKSSLIVVCWDFLKIIDDLVGDFEHLTEEEYEKIKSNTINDIQLTLDNLKECGLVLFSSLSNGITSKNKYYNAKSFRFINEINIFLLKHNQSNLHIINTDSIFAQLGTEQCFDPRDYIHGKAPYTISYFIELSKRINQFALLTSGKIKKALILDCDNTLWGGVVGEDGIKNIEIGDSSFNGKVYLDIQKKIVNLANQGVLIGLCSKNNEKDAMDVFKDRQEMALQENHLTIKKINWKSKAENISEISKTLNIGLDSFVFVDDSDFEINLIKEQLPQVTAIQVPKDITKYPEVFNEITNQFISLGLTKEDLNKKKMYQEQAARDESKKEHINIEDYLESLQTKINITLNDKDNIPRLSQMTQKTNQFNLTTRRYTEADIEKFIKNEKFYVYSFSSSDRFGDNGVVGMAIAERTGETTVNVDSLLMSCRVIGRNIEYSFLEKIVDNLKTEGIIKITSEYIPTQKNDQVSTFYQTSSFLKTKGEENKFELEIKNFNPPKTDYIEVTIGK